MMRLLEYQILFITVLTTCIASDNITCRLGRGFSMAPEKFKKFSCCLCYNYMFNLPGGQKVGSAECNMQSYLIESLNRRSPKRVEPLPNNKDEICRLVGSKSKCEEWVDCCQSAIDCCDDMVAEQTDSLDLMSNNESSQLFCPSTWDTFKCWKKTPPNTSPHLECPSFIIGRVKSCVQPDTHYVERECLSDGNWNNNMSTYLYESSYTRCVEPLDCFKVWENVRHYVEMACEILSLAFILPAILIFISYKTLFKQMRIRIHINLFIALALFDSIHLIYELTVRHPDLVTDVSNNNSVECRVLNALTKFSTLSMFVWMFMEGFYLHWLMVNTFQQPRLAVIFVMGWCIPAVITAVYAVVMLSSNVHNLGCWMDGGDIAWIVNIPLIVCLLVNIIFLVNILRVILPKIAHKNEPVYYRKAVKAIAILMAPFGLLLIFNSYSPDSETEYESKMKYDCVTAAVLHTQGLIISMVLCYTNAEVRGHLRKTFSPYIPCIKDSSNQDASMMTGVSHLSAARPSIAPGTDSSRGSTCPAPENQPLMNHKLRNEESNNNSDGTDVNLLT